MSQRYLGGVITANPTTPTLASASGVWTLEQQFQYSQTIQPKIVGNSVRFRSSVGGYFARTPASTSNRTTWTWSGWIKRGALSGTYGIFGAGTDNGTNRTLFWFTSSDTLIYQEGSTNLRTTTPVYRDPSAWGHLVVAVDNGNATAANRILIYWNGVLQTTTGTGDPGSTQMNLVSVAMKIGTRTNPPTSEYFDGYMAEINFIDGQALTPSSFGAFDSTGVWQPLGYTGTYGTNGFYLNFSDTSGATATTIGKDSSGNGNNWTPNNISVTAGVTYDAMIDSPTNYATGTAYGVGNYATLNPLSYYLSATLSDANLSVSLGTTGNSRATLAPVTGKWYAEYTCTSAGGYSGTGLWIGSAAADFSTPFMSVSYYSNGQTYNNSTFSYVSYGASWTTNDLIGVAWDCDTQQVTFYKNGVSQGTLTSPSISVTTGGAGFAFIPSSYLSGVTSTFAVNFGQRPFTYTPPTGFKALNTSNLPASNINNGAQYMAATTYTGTSATRSISNGGNNPIATTFQPDFVWIKNRTSGAFWHQLYDVNRGPLKALFSNDTSAESTYTDTLTAFTSNGFSLGTDATYNGGVNKSGDSYIGWQWKAGGTAVTNTAGSITSSVSANTTSGFSVVTYTGTGANATVGHGLGVAPSMMIVKRRDNVGAWFVYHQSQGATKYMTIDTAAATTSSTAWNNTAPTSSVFTVGTDNNVNGASGTYVAYLFAEVAGYSKFGSFTGNGSTDGPFVYLGFRPRYVMAKRSDNISDWSIMDTSRNTYNVTTENLYADLSNAADSSYFAIDITSNGFKVRSTQLNVNGGTYIYAAFAENPFNTARAR